MKTATCPKCKGKGSGGWHLDNGRCWACEGTGSVVYLTTEERITLVVAAQDRAMARAQAEGEKCKAEIARRQQEGKRTGYAERQLEKQRELWRFHSRQKNRVLASGKLTPELQETYPSMLAANHEWLAFLMTT